MNKSVLVFLCLIGCMNLGCSFHLGFNSGPSRAQVEREKDKYTKRMKEMMEAMKPQMEILHKIVKEYKDVGVAAVQMKPRGARLYIDGGEYLDSKDEITLPVGTHHFTAVWPDGRQVVRDVYLVTALDDLELKLDFNETDYSMKVNWHTEGPPLKKTSVILSKPN